MVGEIGLNRKEALYELSFWEIVLIIRGYCKRIQTEWEQARFVAYSAAHCMGSKETPPTQTEWYPFPWEKKQKYTNIPTKDEIEDGIEEIHAINAKIKEQGEKP